ncbi:aromatic amino acid lyase [Leucobacter sp. CSA1]|uniref:Aromatic amino acid lyase n=1 Tax=Leucobacter chromiisoli TaxID=2796471 RepID=A0A934Q5S7_9MICO|nr:aromatic amino acid ammonia-lyase [Leucobacter chromiisoli]MBK0417898.1 aromatic amino acid lyase [Leucobacter chromiisoli]
MTYTLPTELTVHDIAAIARGAGIRVSASARRDIAEHHRAANTIAETRPVYGRSTGVGANRLTTAAADPTTHGMNLLRSHAVDAGAPFGAETTRAMLAVRLNQLLQPGSGIDPILIDGLERMLAGNHLPEVRRFGSIGTADLPALAGTALALTGERPTSVDGFEPIGPIRADSALPFMSSSALTLAGSALAAARLETLTRAGLAAFALSALAARANPEAFSPEAALAIGSPTSAANAETLNALLGEAVWDPARIQDPFAYRGFLPAASVTTSAVRRLSESAETLCSSAQENPRFFTDRGTVVHHGAFLENWLAHELDATAIALAQSAPLVVGRLRFINDDAFSGLPRFLAPSGGGDSGTMIAEYVAASALGDILAGAAPVSVQSVVLSCGVEDDATFATTALGKLERSIEAFETLLACEILVAVRALRLSDVSDEGMSPAVRRLLELASALPEDLSDRDLRGDVEVAQSLLDGFAEVAAEVRAFTAVAAAS